MKLLDDTRPEARRVWIEGFRRMSLERKIAIIEGANRGARAAHASGFRMRFPNATAEQIAEDWLKLTMGELAVHCKGRLSMDDAHETMPIVLQVMANFENLGIACALGGSWASSIHGVPRHTYDADVTCAPFRGREVEVAAVFGTEFYISADAMREANRDRSSFNVIQTFMNYKIDVFVQKNRAFDLGIIARRMIAPAPGVPNETIRVLTPEDVILHKLEWFRLGDEVSDRQWSDVLGVLRTQGERIDNAYLDHWAKELGVFDLLEKIREQV